MLPIFFLLHNLDILSTKLKSYGSVSRHCIAKYNITFLLCQDRIRPISVTRLPRFELFVDVCFVYSPWQLEAYKWVWIEWRLRRWLCRCVFMEAEGGDVEQVLGGDGSLSWRRVVEHQTSSALYCQRDASSAANTLMSAPHGPWLADWTITKSSLMLISSFSLPGSLYA